MGSNSKEYAREYYLKNKERIHKIMGEKIICAHCGATVRRSHMSVHHKTVKCMNFKNENGIKL